MVEKGKDCDDFQVGQDRSWTQRRSEIRKESKTVDGKDFFADTQCCQGH